MNYFAQHDRERSEKTSGEFDVTGLESFPNPGRRYAPRIHEHVVSHDDSHIALSAQCAKGVHIA
jgi:hypothetical protein